MEITSIRFSNSKPTEKSNDICGLCSVSIENSIVIHGVKVRRINNEMLIALPERRVGKDNKFKPVITFLTNEFKDKMKTAVLNEYYALISEYPLGYYR